VKFWKKLTAVLISTLNNKLHAHDKISKKILTKYHAKSTPESNKSRNIKDAFFGRILKI